MIYEFERFTPPPRLVADLCADRERVKLSRRIGAHMIERYTEREQHEREIEAEIAESDQRLRTARIVAAWALAVIVGSLVGLAWSVSL